MSSRAGFNTSFIPDRGPGISGYYTGSLQVMVLYRYISWLLTSLFYLAGAPSSPVVFKIGVVVALLVVARAIVELYAYNRENTAIILALVAAETLGIALLLIPTGGLDSPFTWYALNPIFMAAGLYSAAYCWLVLGVFLAAATAGSVLYTGNAVPWLHIWQEKSWLLLVFLLLTTAAQLFMRLVNQLYGAYNELSRAHEQTARSLEHISALYQALEAFSSREDPRRLVNLLAFYTRKLTGSGAGICFLELEKKHSHWYISDPGDILGGIVQKIEIKKIWQYFKEGKKSYSLPLDREKQARQLVFIPVESASMRFGFVGYLNSAGDNAEREKAANFLAELGAVALERLQAEELGERLLVAEEQNRIANEIHDGVSQHLFSIVYSLHALVQSRAELQNAEVQQQLEAIKEVAGRAARELRSSIYRISPLKRGEQVFFSSITAYLEGLEQLNGIEVDFCSRGTEDALSPALRQALYRVICEATSNATRHGECNNIKVSLYMAPGKVVLEIRDDGKGFVVNKQVEGLGLVNMRSLMASFGGTLEINSAPGRGTVVLGRVPAGEIEIFK